MHAGTRYRQPVEGSHSGITHADVMLKAILDASGDLNLACEDTGDTALHLAASRGRASLVKILLKAGVALYCSPCASQIEWHCVACVCAGACVRLSNNSNTI